MSPNPPRSTYRIQLQRGFDLHDAAALAPYLARLGISHVYLSPYLTARPGSTHGYDVVDHRSLNPELGGVEGFRRLRSALEANGLEQVADIVPNHMAVAGADNEWWWDVLKNGRTSRYADYFDIDWEPPVPYLKDKVLLPVLGDPYGVALAAKELYVEREQTEWVVRYHDHTFPLRPESEDDAREGLTGDDLHELLESQHYRLAYWRTGDREVNYRRFFDVKDLAALRTERDDVFEDTHSLLLELIADGAVQGLRIDHIDGLYDPTGYLELLRARSKIGYLVVEKILQPDEELPGHWPVEGTTGYDWLNLTGGLFVDASAEKPLTELYATFTGANTDFDEVVHETTSAILDDVLASEIERLTSAFAQICEEHLEHRDYTSHEIRTAIVALAAAFPVYRTYMAPGDEPSARDVSYVTDAVAVARDRRPELPETLLGFLQEVLLFRHLGDKERAFAMRWQQTTGPAMAKGFEDTALYVYNRFVALNEVGGDPGRFGTSLDEWHEKMSRSVTRSPDSMLATSTHDTKRGEDVRARLCLLSEIPESWSRAATDWAAMNRRHKVDGMPDPNAEYLLYQTLIGAHPLSVERATEYMEKATKEAKVHTSWVDPNDSYDAALRTFVGRILDDRDFLTSLESFVSPLVWPGRLNSLAQTLLKLTAPGVPDFYQGTELWDSSLVDPDNRRPVDFEKRRELLDFVARATPEQMLERAEEGAPKLYLIRHCLETRKRHPDCFSGASYDALHASGAKADHVVSFTRGGRVIVVAPRLVMGLGGDWSDTTIDLPSGAWMNPLTGDEVQGGRTRLTELTARFPVALLVQQAHEVRERMAS